MGLVHRGVGRLDGLHQLGGQLNGVEGIREGLAVDLAIHGIVLGIHPGEHIDGAFGIVLPGEIDGAGIDGGVQAAFDIAAHRGMVPPVGDLQVALEHRVIYGGGDLANAAARLIFRTGTAADHRRGRLPAGAFIPIPQDGVGGIFLPRLQNNAIGKAGGLFQVEYPVGIAAGAFIGGGGAAPKHQGLLEGLHGDIGGDVGHFHFHVPEILAGGAGFHGLHQGGDIHPVAIHRGTEVKEQIPHIRNAAILWQGDVLGVLGLGIRIDGQGPNGHGGRHRRGGEGVRKGMDEFLHPGGGDGIGQFKVPAIGLDIFQLGLKGFQVPGTGQIHGLFQNRIGIKGDVKIAAVRRKGLAVAEEIEVDARLDLIFQGDQGLLRLLGGHAGNIHPADRDAFMEFSSVQDALLQVGIILIPQIKECENAAHHQNQAEQHNDCHP